MIALIIFNILNYYFFNIYMCTYFLVKITVLCFQIILIQLAFKFELQFWTCLLPQFKFISNSGNDLEFKSHSHFNNEEPFVISY